MTNIQSITTHSVQPERLFSSLTLPAGNIRKDVIIEKRISENWLRTLYEGSIFDDVWSVISSKVR